MRNRIHLLDGVPLVVGVYSMLAPLWTDSTTKATWTMIVLGAVTALLAVAELVRPDMMSAEGLMALLGVAFLVAPWVMGFSDQRGMAWTAWIAGVITVAVGAADVGVTRSHHKGTMATSH